MAAIAQAESNGNPSDVNRKASEGPGGSWGLWQINETAHPQYDTQSLLNPSYNAGAAVAVKASQGLSAWSTYTHTTSGGYVGPGSSAAAFPPFLTGGAGSTSSSGTAVPSQVFADVVQTSLNPLVLLNSWVTNPGVNVLYKAFVLCAVLIVLGTVKQTQSYAGWAALCILFLLMTSTSQNKLPATK